MFMFKILEEKSELWLKKLIEQKSKNEIKFNSYMFIYTKNLIKMLKVKILEWKSEL